MSTFPLWMTPQRKSAYYATLSSRIRHVHLKSQKKTTGACIKMRTFRVMICRAQSLRIFVSNFPRLTRIESNSSTRTLEVTSKKPRTSSSQNSLRNSSLPPARLVNLLRQSAFSKIQKIRILKCHSSTHDNSSFTRRPHRNCAFYLESCATRKTYCYKISAATRRCFQDYARRKATRFRNTYHSVIRLAGSSSWSRTERCTCFSFSAQRRTSVR